MRVAVIEGQNHVRAALCFLIEAQPGIQLVGAFGSRPDLTVRLLALRPDMVLLDWELPDHLAEQVLLAARRAPSPSAPSPTTRPRPARWGPMPLSARASRPCCSSVAVQLKSKKGTNNDARTTAGAARGAPAGARNLRPRRDRGAL